MCFFRTTIFALTTCLLLIDSASAACTLDTLKGNFAGQYHLPEDQSQWAAAGAFMANFDGRGKINILRGSEVSNGTRGTGSGKGNYSVRSDCTGTANLTIKASGVVIGKAKLDFYVGGTNSNPEVLGTFINTLNGATGQVRLIHSSL